MKKDNFHHSYRHAIWGIVLVILGLLFLSEQLGWMSIPLWNMVISLPMLFILIGVLQLGKRRHLALGVFLILCGIVFLGLHLVGTAIILSHFIWPVILIAIGIHVLVDKPHRGRYRYYHCHKDWESEKGEDGTKYQQNWYRPEKE